MIHWSWSVFLKTLTSQGRGRQKKKTISFTRVLLHMEYITKERKFFLRVLKFFFSSLCPKSFQPLRHPDLLKGSDFKNTLSMIHQHTQCAIKKTIKVDLFCICNFT